MYTKIRYFTMIVLYLSVSFVRVVAEDTEIESVEGIAPASVELQEDVQSAPVTQDEEKIELEVVNGVVQKKVKTGDTHQVIIEQENIEDAENIESASTLEI